MESILTVGRSHRTLMLRSGLQRYRYPELRLTAPVLAAAGLEPGDRVRVRVVGMRITVQRLEGTTPPPGGASQARRRPGATMGRKRRTAR